MIPNHNASGVRKGFNYQDMVALYYFLNNIQSIKEIKNEGQDDIDVKFKDNSVKYFQAKETSDINHALKRDELKDALITLFDDILTKRKKKVNEIGIITNCNYPFTMKDNNFNVAYRSENYQQLSEVATDRIDELLQEICEEKKNYSKEDFELEKLTIKKIAYQGNDDDSRLERLEKPINKFMDMARIEPSKYYSLLRDWTYIFYKNAEQTKYTVTPEKFVNRTEIIVMDDPNFDDFFRNFHVKTGNKAYIKNNYGEYLEKMMMTFGLSSRIRRDYLSYGMKNPDLYEDEIEVEFVSEEAKDIMPVLGLSDVDRDLDITKLLVWLRITHDSYFETIESAAGIENK